MRENYITKLKDDGCDERQPSSIADIVLQLTDKLDKIKDGMEIKLQVSYLSNATDFPNKPSIVAYNIKLLCMTFT